MKFEKKSRNKGQFCKRNAYSCHSNTVQVGKIWKQKGHSRPPHMCTLGLIKSLTVTVSKWQFRRFQSITYCGKQRVTTVHLSQLKLSLLHM